MRSTKSIGRGCRWLALLALAPGVASAQVTLSRGAFANGDGSVHVLASGTQYVLSGNVGGASAAGALSGSVGGKTVTVASRSQFRLTNVLQRVQEFDQNGDGNIDQATFTYEAPVQNATDATVYRVGEGTGAGTPTVSDAGRTVAVAVGGASGTERKTTRYTAKAGVLTDLRGLPVLHWPATGRSATLCGVRTSKGDCFAQVEQDRARPVMRITAPTSLATVSGTFNLAYTLSEDVKAGAPVTLTRVRGVADPDSPHTTTLAAVAKGAGTTALDADALGLVEGAGYRIAAAVQDNADVGDPYTATANTGSAQTSNVIVTKGAGSEFVYVQAGAAGGDGSAAQPFGTISAALAALPPNGGAILALAGTYRAGESLPLRIPSNVTLRGIGADISSIQGSGGCTVVFDRVQNATISGFRISGGAPSAADALEDSAVCVYGGTGITVRNNVLLGSRNGVRVEESAPLVGRNTLVQNTRHGATLRYPEDATRAGARVTRNVVTGNEGTCVYFEVPQPAAANAGSVVFENILNPAGCGSATAQASLAAANTFLDPRLDQDFVPQASGAVDFGWQSGVEGTTIDQVTPPPPDTVNAMNTAGLLLAVLVAVIVASTVLRRRKGGGSNRQDR